MSIILDFHSGCISLLPMLIVIWVFPCNIKFQFVPKRKEKKMMKSKCLSFGIEKGVPLRMKVSIHFEFWIKNVKISKKILSR